MARILICHVPKDGSIARELGAALMGRDHFVSFDSEPDKPRTERATRLRQFEAVIVIWTEGSAQNSGLADIAREALPLNALVPVRAEELDKTKLPLMFRKLNMFAPRDVDGIARLVARFSTAATSLRDMAAAISRQEKPSMRPEKEPAARPKTPPRDEKNAVSAMPAAAPAARSASAAPPVVEPGAGVRARPLADLPEVVEYDPFAASTAPRTQESTASSRAAELNAALNTHRHETARATVTAADLSSAVDRGLLVPRIPDAMWLGEPVTVEIVLGQDVLARLFPRDFGGGRPMDEDREGIETLSVSLYGHSDVFEIERRSERTQVVNPRQIPPGRDPTMFGRWTWLVTPQTAGRQDLVLRVSALLRDRHGVPEPVALPDRRFEVVVDVPEGADLVPGLIGWQRS